VLDPEPQVDAAEGPLVEHAKAPEDAPVLPAGIRIEAMHATRHGLREIGFEDGVGVGGRSQKQQRECCECFQLVSTPAAPGCFEQGHAAPPAFPTP